MALSRHSCCQGAQAKLAHIRAARMNSTLRFVNSTSMGVIRIFNMWLKTLREYLCIQGLISGDGNFSLKLAACAL